MTNRLKVTFLFLFLLCSSLSCGERVRLGAEVLLEKHLALLEGKRVGVICNHTSVLPSGAHLVDALLSKGVSVTALFGPEHGIRGISAAGEKIGNHKDPKTGIQVYSLYGETRKPSPDMLANVDVLLFDIQDVGARFYTYAATMAYAMEAAAQNGKKFIVVDRPNPINGVDLEGPVLDLTLRSFLGLFPIPIRHGLTLGELAKMIVGEGWIDDTKVDLTVIQMEGWKRLMWYDDTQLPWVAPSPNMKTLATATVYPGACLFEATNVSEGRGTPKPFETIGAPAIRADSLAAALNSLNLPGVKFLPITFTPTPDSVSAPDPKYKNKLCGGVSIQVTERSLFRPVETGLAMINTFQTLYPEKFQIRDGMMDRLLGDSLSRAEIRKNRSVSDILKLSKNQIKEFVKLREKYLLY
jgi:uncharacterized protein YbbC (DUF1343 family)